MKVAQYSPCAIRQKVLASRIFERKKERKKERIALKWLSRSAGGLRKVIQSRRWDGLVFSTKWRTFYDALGRSPADGPWATSQDGDLRRHRADWHGNQLMTHVI